MLTQRGGLTDYISLYRLGVMCLTYSLKLPWKFRLVFPPLQSEMGIGKPTSPTSSASPSLTSCLGYS